MVQDMYKMIEHVRNFTNNEHVKASTSLEKSLQGQRGKGVDPQ